MINLEGTEEDLEVQGEGAERKSSHMGFFFWRLKKFSVSLNMKLQILR